MLGLGNPRLHLQEGWHFPAGVAQVAFSVTNGLQMAKTKKHLVSEQKAEL